MIETNLLSSIISEMDTKLQIVEPVPLELTWPIVAQYEPNSSTLQALLIVDQPQR